MNYRESLAKAKTIFEQGHSAQAVQTAAGAVAGDLASGNRCRPARSKSSKAHGCYDHVGRATAPASRAETEARAHPAPRARPGAAAKTRTGARAATRPATTASVYHRVTIETPVDWRQWYDFYQSVVGPLVESARRSSYSSGWRRRGRWM